MGINFSVLLEVSATTSLFANVIRVSERGRLTFSQRDLKWTLNHVEARYLQRSPRLNTFNLMELIRHVKR